MLDRDIFFARVRARPFAGALRQGQVDGLNFLLDAWAKTVFSDTRWLSYALATTFHETARKMEPVEEIGHGRGHGYGVPTGPWHNVYYGRGDPQLTFETNYIKASKMLARHGIVADLDRYPDKMLDPTIAAAVLYYGMAEGLFTGRKLGDYFSGKHADPIGARRIINGLDRAKLIAGYYADFLSAVTAAA